MFIRLLTVIAACYLFSGCAATKQVVQSCAPKFQLLMDDSLHLVAPLKQPQLNKYLAGKNLNSQREEIVVLKLVKGYVNIYNMILEGHAVLKVDGEDIYFRGSDTDSNMANTDGEWRSVFNKAVKNAIDKVEHKYSQCPVNV